MEVKMIQRRLAENGFSPDSVLARKLAVYLEMLQECGAELIFFSPVHDRKLPEADGLLLGGGYLLLRGVISWHIPAAFLATLALGSAALHLTDAPLTWALYNLCSGGALLGAFFMATDYVTSPVTRRGQLIYGAGCGALTLLFRRTGIYPGGVTYAILLMNGCVWTLDRLTQPRRFGVASKKGDRR